LRDDIPSPPTVRRADDVNGLQPLPWHTALYATVQQLEERLAESERERARMTAIITKQGKQLYDARARLERWARRQQAWTRERNTLLAAVERLSNPPPAPR